VCERTCDIESVREIWHSVRESDREQKERDRERGGERERERERATLLSTSAGDKAP
jgi:hypothetical protein